MILVTVGTHHQPFDRLVRAAERVAASVDERVVVQRGCSRITPVGCAVVDHVGPEQLTAWMREARVLILHGGSSSFLEARALGRVPILVPRRAAHGEHVDDHQLEFGRSLPRAEAVLAEPEELPAIVATFVEARGPEVDRSRAFADRLGPLIAGLVRAGVSARGRGR